MTIPLGWAQDHSENKGERLLSKDHVRYILTLLQGILLQRAEHKYENTLRKTYSVQNVGFNKNGSKVFVACQTI
jgi:hypothetical protein